MNKWTRMVADEMTHVIVHLNRRKLEAQELILKNLNRDDHIWEREKAQLEKRIAAYEITVETLQSEISFIDSN